MTAAVAEYYVTATNTVVSSYKQLRVGVWGQVTCP